MKNVLIIHVNYGPSPLLYLYSKNYIPLQDVFSVATFVIVIETIFNNTYTVRKQ